MNELVELWVDPVRLGDPAVEPILMRYPDGSLLRCRRAFVGGPSTLLYKPEGFADGKHVALLTYADVETDDLADELVFACARLRDAVGRACDRLERAGDVDEAGCLREAATLAGFPPRDPNPLQRG